MLSSRTLRRTGLLFLGTAVGSWLGLRLQFGFRASPYVTEELGLVAVALAISLVAVALFAPMSLAFQRALPSHATAAVSVAAVLVSVAFGLWVYVGILHRPLSLVLERDWSYVLYFGLSGVGYAASYALQRRI